MSLPTTPEDQEILTTSPVRQQFLQRLASTSIKPAAHDYYVRWAEAWSKARGNRSSEHTLAY